MFGLQVDTPGVHSAKYHTCRKWKILQHVGTGTVATHSTAKMLGHTTSGSIFSM